MSKNVIFCYSGTGNCLDIAKNIAKRLGDTDIIMMRSAPAITDVRNARKVGFVFPCYAGGLPGNVEEYVRRIKVDPKAYTFGVVSYAAYPGIGLSKIIPLDYHAGISHQCSCIWLIPHEVMMPPVDPHVAQKRSEKLAAKIAEDVYYVKRSKRAPASNPINKFESKAWPVVKTLQSSRLRSNSNCVACGQCVKLCPKGNITLENGKVSFGKNCIGCLSCLQYCPTQAISMGGLTKNRSRYHNPNVSAADLYHKIIHVD
jgi:ferredoxin